MSTRKWWHAHTWKYVVRECESEKVILVCNKKVTAMCAARTHFKWNHTEMLVRRVSTWLKAGRVLKSWSIGGMFDNCSGANY